MARLDDEEVSDAELEEEIATRRSERPKASAVATVEAEPPVQQGGEPSSNGEPPSTDPVEVERRERNERRRERRQQRRKHGRNR